MFDLSVHCIDLRFKSERDKIVIKTNIFSPKIIQKSKQKSKQIQFIKDISHSKVYEHGYHKVQRHDAQKNKWKCTVQFVEKNIVKTKIISGRTTRETYGLKCIYIKQNYEKWKKYHLMNVKNVFEESNKPVLDKQFFRIYRQNGCERTWLSLKNKIPNYLSLVQEKNFQNSKIGKILKKYNTRWFKNNIMYKIRRNGLIQLIQLRTGTSPLKYHTSITKINGVRDTKCQYCKNDSIENNYHFFFECQRYKISRKVLFDNVKPLLDKMGLDLNETTILCFFPQIERHGQSRIKYRITIISVIESVCDYIWNSGRFN